MIQHKRKIFWQIELNFILIIIAHIFTAAYFSQFLNTIPILIAELFVYSLMSLISYYVYDDKVIFADPKIPVDYPRYELNEQEKIEYYNQVFLNFGLLKLSIVVFLFSILLIELLILPEALIYIMLVFFFIILGIIIIRLSKSVLSAKGYKDIPSIDILRKFTIYHNPDDKRAVIDKPFGVGSTINLATKQGKLIIAVILGIPLFIISLLLIILSLAGEI